MFRRAVTITCVSLACFAGAAHDAFALDRQGSAHGGSATASTRGRNITGALFLGASFFNPSYGARPDNSGLALMRYGAHLDVDLLGSLLSIPIDLNAFSDRTREGIHTLAPSEFDVIAGLTSTINAGPGAFEIGARAEHDAPADRPGFQQTYADVRARYLFSLASVSRRVNAALLDGDLSGWLTLGWFAINPSYAARPDNSGLALLRYAAHVELSVWHDYLSFGVDATMFTDRETNAVRPSELDFTAEIIGRYAPLELHVAYERDMPVDRGGLVQHFAYLLLSYSFDLSGREPPPLEARHPIVSP
jgi:hypothetical protein